MTNLLHSWLSPQCDYSRTLTDPGLKFDKEKQNLLAGVQIVSGASSIHVNLFPIIDYDRGYECKYNKMTRTKGKSRTIQ